MTYISNLIKLGWVNNAQLYNPENPYLRVLTNYRTDVKALKLELQTISLNKLYYFPHFIFKNSYSKAFHLHVRYRRGYLNHRINRFDKVITISSDEIINYSNTPIAKQLFEKEYFNIYGAIRSHNSIYYIYRSRIIHCIDDVNKLNSLELMQSYDKAHNKLKYLGVF